MSSTLFMEMPEQDQLYYPLDHANDRQFNAAAFLSTDIHKFTLLKISKQYILNSLNKNKVCQHLFTSRVLTCVNLAESD